MFIHEPFSYAVLACGCYILNVSPHSRAQKRARDICTSLVVEDPGYSQLCSPICGFFRLRVFDSGVMVIELQSHKEEEMVASALETVCEPRFLLISLPTET